MVEEGQNGHHRGQKRRERDGRKQKEEAKRPRTPGSKPGGGGNQTKMDTSAGIENKGSKAAGIATK
jgi:hypothetical protein